GGTVDLFANGNDIFDALGQILARARDGLLHAFDKTGFLCFVQAAKKSLNHGDDWALNCQIILLQNYTIVLQVRVISAVRGSGVWGGTGSGTGAGAAVSSGIASVSDLCIRIFSRSKNASNQTTAPR